MHIQRDENPVIHVIESFECFDSFRFTYRCARFNMQNVVGLRSLTTMRFKLIKIWD